MILAVVILNISLDCFGAFLKVRMLLFKYQKKRKIVLIFHISLTYNFLKTAIHSTLGFQNSYVFV
ncbi:hypothetical protein SDC9_65356 [bioreactor metagenome]|uniref:Uncharacterized protein n=1 Tax=bioreactor metagenome TaxID=1076179 RepID=A0A644XT48_9ZZZZ